MSFGHWFQQAGRAKVEVEEEDPRKEVMDPSDWPYKLLEANYWPPVDSKLYYPCVMCGEDTEVECEPHEFNGDMHYCGRTPHCCP